MLIWGQSQHRLTIIPSQTDTLGELRFREQYATGANYVGFKAPNALTGNHVWTLPSNNNNGFVKNTGGVWSFESTVGGVGDEVDARSYGAVCSGGTNPASTLYASDAAVQAAFPATTALMTLLGGTLPRTTDELDWLGIQEALQTGPNAGRTVVLPTGICVTNRVIQIGDGGESRISSKHSRVLRGMGSGLGGANNTAPGLMGATRIWYTGPVLPTSAFFEINGAISAPGIRDLDVRTDSKLGYGVRAYSASHFRMQNIGLNGYRSWGIWLGVRNVETIVAPGSQSIRGGCWANFENILFALEGNYTYPGHAGENANGMYMSGTPGVMDTCSGVFNHARVEYSGKTGTTGLYLGYTDSHTFNQWIFAPVYDSDAIYDNGVPSGQLGCGLTMDGGVVTGFPGGTLFTASAFGLKVCQLSSANIGTQSAFGMNIGDCNGNGVSPNPCIPANAITSNLRLKGFDDGGNAWGSWTWFNEQWFYQRKTSTWLDFRFRNDDGDGLDPDGTTPNWRIFAQDYTMGGVKTGEFAFHNLNGHEFYGLSYDSVWARRFQLDRMGRFSSVVDTLSVGQGGESLGHMTHYQSLQPLLGNGLTAGQCAAARMEIGKQSTAGNGALMSFNLCPNEPANSYWTVGIRSAAVPEPISVTQLGSTFRGTFDVRRSLKTDTHQIWWRWNQGVDNNGTWKLGTEVDPSDGAKSSFALSHGLSTTSTPLRIREDGSATFSGTVNAQLFSTSITGLGVSALNGYLRARSMRSTFYSTIGTSNGTPTVSSGDAITTSMMYWDSSDETLKMWTGLAWTTIYPTGSGSCAAPCIVDATGTGGSAIIGRSDLGQVPFISEGYKNDFLVPAAGMIARTYRGGPLAKTAVQPGDRLGVYLASGHDTSAVDRNVVGIEMFVDAAGTVSGTSLPSYMTFATTPNFSNARVTRMTIGSSGTVTIGGLVESNTGYKLYRTTDLAASQVSYEVTGSGVLTWTAGTGFPGGSGSSYLINFNAVPKLTISQLGDVHISGIGSATNWFSAPDFRASVSYKMAGFTVIDSTRAGQFTAVYPSSDNGASLGADTQRWANVVAGTQIYLYDGTRVRTSMSVGGIQVYDAAGNSKFSVSSTTGNVVANGSPGLSGTFTVRDAGGGGDCNIVVINGIVTGGTC
jgi:hypothetical protein